MEDTLKLFVVTFGVFSSFGSISSFFALGSWFGQLTSFASKGRVEDIFLRFLDWCDERGEPLENQEYLRKSLKHLKYEAEMLDKIGRIQELERELSDINRKKYEAEEKLRSYNPDMIKTLSLPEAYRREQFVMDALERIEKLKRAKLLEKEISPSNPNDVEMPALEVGSSSAVAEATNSETQRNQLPDDHNGKNIEELEPSTKRTWLLAEVICLKRHKFQGNLQHRCGYRPKLL